MAPEFVKVTVLYCVDCEFWSLVGFCWRKTAILSYVVIGERFDGAQPTGADVVSLMGFTNFDFWEGCSWDVPCPYLAYCVF